MAKNKKFPSIKKNIENFVKGEEGKISSKSILELGFGVVGLSLLIGKMLPTKTAEAVTSHLAHSSSTCHSSHGSACHGSTNTCHSQSNCHQSANCHYNVDLVHSSTDITGHANWIDSYGHTNVSCHSSSGTSCHSSVDQPHSNTDIPHSSSETCHSSGDACHSSSTCHSSS